MPRPTLDELRRLLDDLGLDSVDPSAFFSSTSPELIRLLIDAGPIKPPPTLNVIQNLTFASALNLSETFNITAAEEGTIRVVKNLTIDIVNAVTSEIFLQHSDGLTTARLWRDLGGPQFGIGQYIGTDNDASRAWGALGLNNIVLYPAELTTTTAAPRFLQVRLDSVLAENKTVTVSMTLIDFDSRLFAGGDW